MGLKSAFLFLGAIVAGGILFANDPLAIGSLGADYANLSKAEATKLGIAGGVVVTRIHEGEALSNQTKMRVGFVITRIGNLPVTSIDGLKYALSRQKSNFVIQGIYPGSKQVYYYSIHDF